MTRQDDRSTDPAAGETAAEEQALLERLRRGEEGAFEELVRSHGPRLLTVIRRILPQEEDARDALQDALLSVSRAVGGFAGESRLSTWLHRIAVNAALMRLRTQRRQEPPIASLLPRFQENGHMAEPAGRWEPPPEAALERSETHRFVRESISELPDSYRIVLTLRDIEEWDTRETAEFLGIEPNAVKVRLHRARQALRTILDKRFRA